MALSLFDRMKQAVTRTRDSLSGSLSSVIALTREVDDLSLDALELALLAADIGAPTTAEIITALRDRALRQGISSSSSRPSCSRSSTRSTSPSSILRHRPRSS